MKPKKNLEYIERTQIILRKVYNSKPKMKVEELDIWQSDGSTIYVLNSSRKSTIYNGLVMIRTLMRLLI